MAEFKIDYEGANGTKIKAEAKMNAQEIKEFVSSAARELRGAAGSQQIESRPQAAPLLEGSTEPRNTPVTLDKSVAYLKKRA